MKNLRICYVLCLSALALVANAQIKGTVFEDPSGEPAIGATVVAVGTSSGTVTDFDGVFELNVPEGTKLQISYIGFETQQLAAKNGMIVRMKEETIQLNEVVAIGYGSQKKKEVTGSVASVKAEDFNAGVKSSPVGLLQGKVAGLNIINNSSDPTQGGYKVQIRGFSTLDKGAGSEPLYIVDGVPVSGIDNISPDEIASMDVLKDGSAAAIYGTRGSNGVIVVTTKKGSKDGQTHTSYSGQYSWDFINKELQKVVNPNYGSDVFMKSNNTIYYVGDIVLKQFVDYVVDFLKPYNTVTGRWGGEEFLCVCYKMDIEQTRQLAEKLRVSISEAPFDNIYNLTCSIGLTEISPADTEKSAFDRADKAMYDAKTNGRNCVVAN